MFYTNVGGNRHSPDRTAQGVAYGLVEESGQGHLPAQHPLPQGPRLSDIPREYLKSGTLKKGHQ